MAISKSSYKAGFSVDFLSSDIIGILYFCLIYFCWIDYDSFSVYMYALRSN